jgi:hypothetical protein
MLGFAILVLVALYFSATAPVEPAAVEPAPVTGGVPARQSGGNAP